MSLGALSVRHGFGRVEIIVYLKAQSLGFGSILLNLNSNLYWVANYDVQRYSTDYPRLGSRLPFSSLFAADARAAPTGLVALPISAAQMRVALCI